MTTKEKKIKKAPEELKVVVRKLPPTLSSDVFMKSIQAYKDTVSYFYFVPGKNKEKSFKYGRAFLTFNKMDDKTNFLKNYKPSFIDDKGNTYLAKLEEALYQVDVANLNVKTNPKEGTYLESPEYKAFMEKLAGQNSVPLKGEKKDVVVSVDEHKKVDKTPLVLDIERRMAEKREKDDGKKRAKNAGPKVIYKEKNKDGERDNEKAQDKGKDYVEKGNRDNRDQKEYVDNKDYKDSKGYSDNRDYRDPKDYKNNNKDYRDNKNYNNKGYNDKDYNNKGYKDNYKDYRDTKDYNDREYNDNRDYRENKDYKDNRDGNFYNNKGNKNQQQKQYVVYQKKS